ncbi:Ribose-phosphate pyrophosphokinase [Chlamydiales bacterium STE3]|nr:Ribose-phosphate pyrophosphokinase [Chlamydiales bacterium STE3]
MNSSEQSDFLLFAGSSNQKFANEVADCLGVLLGKVHIDRFPDGEISLQVMENVRGRDTFVLQTIALDPNNLLLELLIMVDALKRASAKSIVAVIPYFGYCRQDRKDKPRVPITAKLVANLLENAGVTRVITMDLHAEQIQGFFDIPVDNLYARPLMAKAIKALNLNNLVVVAPDIGSVKIAKTYVAQLNVDFAVVDKDRVTASKVETVTLIGDVKGKDVLLADDMCTTGETLLSAAKACREKGALRIFAVLTHGLFVNKALEKIEQSPIEAIFVANTIPSENRFAFTKKIKTISVSNLFSQAIRYNLSNESISSLFEINYCH